MTTEIEAMQAIADALDDISDEEGACERVLAWAASKYCGRSAVAFPAESTTQQEATLQEESTTATYSGFADLWEHANPTTQMDRAIVAAYWFQEVNGDPGVKAQLLNRELRNLGYAIPNITDALTSAMGMKPALVMQIGKTGKSQQARKTYKLTGEGIKYVRNMLDHE